MLGLLKDLMGEKKTVSVTPTTGIDAVVDKYLLLTNPGLKGKKYSEVEAELKQDISDFCEKYGYSYEDFDYISSLSQLAFFRLSKLSKMYTIEKVSGNRKHLSELKKRSGKFYEEYKLIKALA